MNILHRKRQCLHGNFRLCRRCPWYLCLRKAWIWTTFPYVRSNSLQSMRNRSSVNTRWRPNCPAGDNWLKYCSAYHNHKKPGQCWHEPRKLDKKLSGFLLCEKHTHLKIALSIWECLRRVIPLITSQPIMVSPTTSLTHYGESIKRRGRRDC